MRNLLLVAITLVAAYQPHGVAALSSRTPKNVVIIEGTILDMSPVFGGGMPSGILPHYRLVKYRVDRVCKGKYEGREIVIDHIIDGNREILKDRKIGDKVYVLASRDKKAGTIYTYKGIRDSPGEVKYLYHGEDVLSATPPSCSVDVKDFLLAKYK
jgi:hypothetical protein